MQSERKKGRVALWEVESAQQNIVHGGVDAEGGTKKKRMVERKVGRWNLFFPPWLLML